MIITQSMLMLPVQEISFPRAMDYRTADGFASYMWRCYMDAVRDGDELLQRIYYSAMNAAHDICHEIDECMRACVIEYVEPFGFYVEFCEVI